MTKISFHILPASQQADMLNYLCRLVVKALSQSHRILIATESVEQQQLVSDALWAFHPESFITHNLIDEADHRLQLSASKECGAHHDVLINLRQDTPEFFSRFERLIELVYQSPEWLAASRQRYRYYSDLGYPLQRHDLRDQV